MNYACTKMIDASVLLYFSFDSSFSQSRSMHNGIGCMVIAVLFSFIHVDEQSSQIICIGRCANLVINHTDSIVRLADIQHGLNKVLTIHPKHPSNADDEILLQCLANCQFPFQLRLAVYIPPPLIRRKNSNRVEYNVHFSSYVGTFSIFPFIFRQKEKSHRPSDQ